MASVTRLDAGGRAGFRIRFYVENRRRSIYVAGSGKRVERKAEIVARHCDELATAKGKNVLASADAVAWANGTDGKLRENLVAWGLADPASPRLLTDDGRLLGPFLTAYIDGRSDVKAVTRTNYRQTRRLLVEYFGERHPLRSITPADAERWRRSLMMREVKAATEDTPAETMAVASVSKHCKRAKTMLAEAVSDRLLSVSPFAGLKGGNEANPDRQRFVDRATVDRVLAACPDADWRLLFSLARFGGLRCPSEVLGLKWSDIDWDGGRLRIESSKTGLRFCPMFPELRLALGESFEAAPDGAVYCVGRYRGAESNLRTQLGRIIEAAGVVPWVKPFVNLRSTRRTELQEKFPDHVVNKWLGHSGAVAAKHYLQVTEEHWGRAIDSGVPIGVPIGVPTGVPINGKQGPSEQSMETKKPSVLLGSDVARGLLMDLPMTPTGIEPVLPP